MNFYMNTLTILGACCILLKHLKYVQSKNEQSPVNSPSSCRQKHWFFLMQLFHNSGINGLTCQSNASDDSDSGQCGYILKWQNIGLLFVLKWILVHSQIS